MLNSPGPVVVSATNSWRRIWKTRLITGALLVEVVVVEVLMPGEAKPAICVST